MLRSRRLTIKCCPVSANVLNIHKDKAVTLPCLLTPSLHCCFIMMLYSRACVTDAVW